MSYLNYWQVNRRVFALDSPSDLYISHSLNTLISHSISLLSTPNNICMFTNNEGYSCSDVGKYLYFHLSQDTFECLYIPIINKQHKNGWIIQSIANFFKHSNIQNEISIENTLYDFSNYLQQLKDEHKSLIIFLDGFDKVVGDGIDDIIAIKNFQEMQESSISFVLLTENKLQQNRLKPLINMSCSLPKIAEEEILDYFNFYCSRAKLNPNIFTHESLALIYTTSLGHPKIINSLAENSLIYCAANNFREVNIDVLQIVINEFYDNLNKPESSTLNQIVKMEKINSAHKSAHKLDTISEEDDPFDLSSLLYKKSS